MLIVAIGLKVMNEPSQLTPISLRDFVVLERSQSGDLFFLAAEAAFYRRGSCAEFFSEAHRSHASWFGSVSSWSCCLAALVATKLGLSFSFQPARAEATRRAKEKKTPTCDQLCFEAHRSRRPRIVLGIRGRANFSSSFQAYLGSYLHRKWSSNESQEKN